MSRVIFLGDSLTWGGYGGNYVEAVRERVGTQHEIINAGVGGNTTVNVLRRLARDVIAHEPDKVLVMMDRCWPLVAGHMMLVVMLVVGGWW